MKKYLPNGIEGLFSFSKTVLTSRRRAIRFSLVILLVVSVSVLLAGMYSGAEAETEYIPAEITMKDVESGSLLFKTDKPGKYIPAPVLRTEVEMQVTGIVLRSKVKQIFRNSSDFWWRECMFFRCRKTPRWTG